jgi:hypothetical protein
MKFFLRGILALGLPAILATIASAQNPAPAPAQAPAAGPAVVSGGCSNCGAENGGGQRRYGLFGRYQPPAGGDRVDHFMDRYQAITKCQNNFLQRLAGPQINPAPASACKGKGGPNVQPGTLVFPQHPFIRSPRDYFMED